MGNTKIPGIGLWCTEKVNEKENESVQALSIMSIDSKFENDMLNKYEDQTFTLNKDVESSITKIFEAKT